MKIILNTLLFLVFALFFFNIAALEATRLMPQQQQVVTQIFASR